MYDEINTVIHGWWRCAPFKLAGRPKTRTKKMKRMRSAVRHKRLCLHLLKTFITFWVLINGKFSGYINYDKKAL